MTSTKKKIVFVGAFQVTAKDGSVGGQLYACTTLIASPISDQIQWVLLDSTMESLPPPSLKRRSWLAIKRLFLFSNIIRKKNIAGTLIFTSAGMSFMEKGTMVLIASFFHKFVVFAPRSGLILDDLQRAGWMKWFIRFVLNHCNIILCQSNSWKSVYQSLTGLPNERFSVIYNWFDTKPFLNLPREYRKNGRQPIKFLYLGWLEKYKGIYDLIEAVALVREEIGNSLFVICGKGSKRGEIELLIQQYGLTDLFEFRGWVLGDDKLISLSEADVFVLPSHREGLPNALLEAMASGLPVIATSVGAIPEVVGNQDRGLLFQPGDVDGLGEALVDLQENATKRKKLGQHARDYVLEYHDIENVWISVLNLFNDSQDVL